MELQIIPLENEDSAKWIVYRPLLGLAFVANRAMVELCRQVAGCETAGQLPVSPEVRRFLSDVGFFQPDPTIPALEANLFQATLLVTNRCQLRCIYCYAAAGESEEKVISMETARAVIDAACARSIEKGLPNFTLEIHGGGEPTLEWGLLQQVVAYARSRPLPARVSLTSNGIWSAALCEWVAANIDSLTISMDGAPETQNANRPLRDQAPSFPIVMRSLQCLDEKGVNYGIRLTCTTPWQRLPQDVAYLIEHTRCRRLSVEPAFNDTRGQTSQPDESQAGAFCAAFIEAYESARARGVELKFSGARLDGPTRQYCRAPYNALVVNPNDQIVACYETASSSHPLSSLAVLGQVRDGRLEHDHAARSRLLGQLHERFEHCQDCFCRWTCAGGCFARFFLPGVGGHLQYGLRCEVHRTLTRYLILDRIAAGGGVWRSRPPLHREVRLG